MKNPNISFPVIFLSIVLAVVSAPCAVQGQGAVLDTKGRPVRPGVPYYVLPAEDGNGGGIRHESRASFHPRFCPIGVTQSQFPGVLGDPVTFSPWNSALGFIPASTNLTIEFESDRVDCPQSLVWTTVFSAWLRGWYVSTGGARGDKDSWFQIVRDGDGYKIIAPSRGFRTVGIFKDTGADVRVVVLASTPLKVKFQMAYETPSQLLKKAV